MDVGVYPYSRCDPLLIDKIVNEFLSQGKFDKLRKECMSDADTKPAYQNLQQRVENTVTQFLKKQIWKPDLNKNQLRDSLRKHILESKFFDAGINRIVDQVVNPNVLATVFLPEVEEVVYNCLSIPKPSDKCQRRGPLDERFRPVDRDYEYKTSQENERYEKRAKDRSGDHKKENHYGDENYKTRDAVERKSKELFKAVPPDYKEKIKSEPEEEIDQTLTPVKMEITSDESEESLSRMAVDGLHLNEGDCPPVPDSDDSAPLEINEKSMSDSRDSEDSIMNQMSPISQGRLTPELEDEAPEVKTEETLEIKPEETVEVKPEETVEVKPEETPEVKPEETPEVKPEETPEMKPEEKPEEKKPEEKKPLTFIGRIPKIKREEISKPKEEVQKKEKLDVKNVYSSDESDSIKSCGKSDSDERRKKNDKDRKREELDKREKEKKRDNSKDRRRERSRERHKDQKDKRQRSRERHKKSSSSSSSSQRERSSSHKSSHRHKDSKSKRKEEEKKKSKTTDDHGKERNKKEDRRSTDRDSNERERGRSSGGRTEGESRKREKEQSKTEETREETNQKEVETECEVVQTEVEVVDIECEVAKAEEKTVDIKATDYALNEDFVLDFDKLYRLGELTQLKFPRLTDDFYVKFNSTGFRYFEEWEKTKLDCEEEFKEFVDEAENDLSLLSDDESDLEFENFAEENRKIIKNLLKGLGNFRRCLMFDPATSQFYKWTNNKFYQKFRKKCGERKNAKTESDESIKENIDRGEKSRALHLKLLNKYKRKAMRMGKPRRRHRRPESGGIKEKNENRRDFFNGVHPRLPEPENTTVPEGVNSLDLYRGEEVTLPESPEENQEWVNAQREGNTDVTQSLPLNLPPSPDSDDVNTNITSKPVAVPRKRINRETEGETPKKQTKRNCSQKYDSQDLYKPRPMLHGSRTRGREKGLHREIVSLDSPVST